MAIAFGTAGNAIAFTNVANPSGTFTVGALTNGLLITAIESDADVVTAATYNSASMSLLKKETLTDGRFIYMFGLLNPASGSNTLQLTVTGGHFTAANCATYSGVNQSGLPDNSTSATSVTSPVTGTLTPVAANAWTIANTASSAGTTSSAGAGTTGRIVGGTAEQSYVTMVDSNGPVSGSTSLVVNYSGVPVSIAMCMVSVAPVPDVVINSNHNLSLLGAGN